MVSHVVWKENTGLRYFIQVYIPTRGLFRLTKTKEVVNERINELRRSVMSLDFHGNGNTNSERDWIINVVARQSRRSCVRVVQGTSVQ